MKLDINLGCIKYITGMNFRIIIIITLVSLLFNKSINRKQNTSQILINQQISRNQNSEEIITIDFEGDVSDWNQDISSGWNLTTNSYDSPNHSYNSPDENNTGLQTTYNLYSQQISLPTLVDGEIIQYSFSLNCNMPDFI